jgi:inhibitor of cysteine peptidase
MMRWLVWLGGLVLAVVLGGGATLALASQGSATDGQAQYEVDIRFNTSVTQEDINEADAILRAFDDDLDFLVLESFPPIGRAFLETDEPNFCSTVTAALEAESYVDSASCGPRRDDSGGGDPNAPVQSGPQPVAAIALPEPGSTVDLYDGCNNLALTFPDGTTSETVVAAVTPAGAVEAMWRHDAALGTFEGYDSRFPAASDLRTVDFLDAVWLCVAAPASLTLSEADAGSTVTLAVGDTMEVVLDGNPTTGFTWETEALDTSVLRQLGESEFQPESALIGAGGTFTFRFEAVASGQTTLRLVYHRPWETDVPPEKTYEVTASVSSSAQPGSEGALTVAELLASPVYDEQVRVYGQVSLLGELFCPCFELASGGQTLVVWYDLMVDEDGTVRPAVSVEGIDNGDTVLVTGELKTGDGQAPPDELWASAIEKSS